MLSTEEKYLRLTVYAFYPLLIYVLRFTLFTGARGRHGRCVIYTSRAGVPVWEVRALYWPRILHLHCIEALQIVQMDKSRAISPSPNLLKTAITISLFSE